MKKPMDRQRELEALGWTFERRNSKGKWVRYKSNTNQRHQRMLAWVEKNGEAK